MKVLFISKIERIMFALSNSLLGILFSLLEPIRKTGIIGHRR